MDWTALIIAAIGSGGLGAVAATVWKAAKTAARNELLVEQAQKTVAAKDTENEALRKENADLWALANSLTTPEERT